jgi:hypothetical protein
MREPTDKEQVILRARQRARIRLGTKAFLQMAKLLGDVQVAIDAGDFQELNHIFAAKFRTLAGRFLERAERLEKQVVDQDKKS